jgi:hypothetical protein
LGRPEEIVFGGDFGGDATSINMLCAALTSI